ncbi:TetR/AcrR family transcriptional regulator [Sphingopyxis sp. JAI108]|uniref:TetR/AcrR family transcriptional regulator n=1 Tax=Sphingopyxis sp. JAI108 TaxID=2723060 RepID=UPI00179A4A16|nr:TetR/AcrR family transcriptional regulator [Sphingopyxis sp. JAI108]NYF30639.1 AcrR family transcriptional regulator [Sphingopyxis sp. JAI108]
MNKPAKPTRHTRRPTKADQRAATMEQIYDAAEELFSKRGLYGVTLKEVAAKVGVHQSLLHYYFKDKKELFDAVIARRAPVTIERRMKALDAYERAVEGRPTVEGALRAYLDTDLELHGEGGLGWRHYGQLGAQMSNTAEWGAELMDTHFDEVVLRLIAIIRKAMPDCPDEDLFWGYHFVSAGLMLTLGRTGRIDKLSGGLCKSDDFDAVKERMARFMAAGFIATCEARRAQREAAKQ